MLRLSPMFNRIATITGLCAFVAIFSAGVVFAAQDSNAIAQTFQTKEKLVSGALVSLQPNSPKVVEASNTSRVGQLIGIVANKPLVEFSDGQSTISVVTSGTTEALVSDINGSVSTGDKITASPINNVGMKVTDPVMTVGTAQGNLKDVKTTEYTIKDKEGVSRTVHVGLIPVQVNVTFYANASGIQSYIPGFLQDAANALAGKEVSPVRVLASLLLAVLALISVTVLLYSSVRSSIISIGRNPLSEKAVHKGLFEVGGVIGGILLAAFGAIYAILILS